MVAPYTVEGDLFRAEKPRVWSEAQWSEARFGSSPNRVFDLHPDGRRFAVLKSLVSQAEPKRDRLTLIFNFGDELRRIAPERQR